MKRATPMLDVATQLVTEWRSRAQLLRAHGAKAPARAIDHLATELEATLARAADELLTPTAAAHETGLHPDSVTRLIRSGKLANAGRPHAPRVRRGDLTCLTSSRGPRSDDRSGAKPPSVASLSAVARDAIAAKTSTTRGGR